MYVDKILHTYNITGEKKNQKKKDCIYGLWLSWLMYDTKTPFKISDK
jgi:hypothetical protein